jgi:phage terminase large subunit
MNTNPTKVEFIRTRAINKLGKLKKRIKIVQGSTSAGKTIGILAILINKAIKYPGLEISVVAESVPHLKKGALKDFLKIMKMTKRFDKANYNKTERIYTFSNGSTMEFFGVADDPDKLRGPRRDILYMNEVSNLPWEAYKQGSIRTNAEIWLDFNPSHEFWVHEELEDDPDVEWITLTYDDNEALTDALVREIEKAKTKAFHNPNLKDPFIETNIKNKYWANWWKVYGLGELGALEGVIFTNWEEIEEVPRGATYLGSGVDFGYTNDPTAIVDFYKYNGQIIWDEATYAYGLTNPMIARELKKQGKTAYTTIISESAEPKSIDEINTYGFSLQAVEKGPDSINFGISIMQEMPFLVTKQSTNIKTELRRYQWKVDKKTNKSLNIPEDKNNHAIDGARYFYMEEVANKNYRDEAPADEAYEMALKLLG